MAKENELVIKINGDIKGYKQALKDAARETEDLQSQLNEIAKIGAVLFAGFGSAIAFSTARFAEFDHGLRGVKTLLDESSFSTKTLEKGFQDMSAGALDALKEFPLELQSLNKSLFDIVSAGVPAAKAIEVLGSTSRLAVAGITTSAIATDAVTSALNAYGLEAEHSELVAAKFFTAQKFGKTTIAELSKFMGEAVSSAAAFGISLDELLASTAAATSGGIKTSQAFTSLTAILANIAQPTKDAKDESQRLGIEFNSTAIRAQGLTKFLKNLTEAEGFNEQSAEKLFGSTEALKVVYALTGSGAEKYKETLDALADSQKVLTTFTEAYQIQNESLKNQTTILKNNFDALAIAVGSNFAPTVGSLAKSLTSLLSFLQDNPGLTSFISKILIAGTVMGGLTLAVGLGGLAFLKYRAAMAAAAVTTTGLTLTTKVLLGSTGLGLLIAFLPEIIQLLEGGIVPALGAVALGLTATVLATRKATSSTAALGIAVKGLVGSTGIGLLLVFLPEITEALRKFFDTTNDLGSRAAQESKQIALDRSKDELEILEAKQKKLTEIEISFIRRRQEIRKRLRARKDIEDKELAASELENIELLHKQLAADIDKFNKEKLKRKKEEDDESLDSDKEATDTKLRGLKNANALIKAELDGAQKEKLGFLKREQQIEIKTAEANAEKDKNRRAAMLENVELLNKQLVADKEKTTAKLAEIEEERVDKLINGWAKETEIEGEKEEADEKKTARETERAAKEKAATTERIQNLKDEAEIIKAGQDDLEAKEIEFIGRKQTLRGEEAAANKLAAGEEKDLALANNKLKTDELLAEQEKFSTDLAALKAEEKEIEDELQEELNQLSAEQRAALTEEDLRELRAKLETEDQLKRKAAKKEFDANRKERALFRADEEKHGKIIANANAFFRNQNVQGASNTINQLAALQRSGNSTMRSIGKAAALIQIGINTSKGAIAAYSSLAGIPIVGPALGAAAAAALVVFGVEQAAQVQRFETGGFVGGRGAIDSQIIAATPGEFIVPPQSAEEVIGAVARQRAEQQQQQTGEDANTATEDEEGRFLRIEVGFDGEEAADVLTVKQNEQRFLGVSQAI